VGWIHDNAGTGGTQWKTDISRFYGFADSADDVCNWDGPKIASTQRNWTTLNLQKQHDPGVADGWSYVGDHSNPLGPQPGKYHGLVSTTIPAHADSQICDQNSVSAHNATVSASACTAGSAADKARNAVWLFMLTNP
jgi:hypothetical protein